MIYSLLIRMWDMIYSLLNRLHFQKEMQELRLNDWWKKLLASLVQSPGKENHYQFGSGQQNGPHTQLRAEEL